MTTGNELESTTQVLMRAARAEIFLGGVGPHAIAGAILDAFE